MLLACTQMNVQSVCAGTDLSLLDGFDGRAGASMSGAELG